MHPAFSVILFTALSGAGYGLLFWLAVLVIIGQAARNPLLVVVAAATAFVLIAAGLLSSMMHLGRPERAWRAFSQWRSSWLSREGVAAVVSFVPLFALAMIVWFGGSREWQVVTAVAACVMAIVTVFCTSRIYDTLKPIPAWTTGWVLANYLMLAAASGAVWLWAIGVLGFAMPAHRGDGMLILLLVLAAAAMKLAYWRHIDRRQPMTAIGAAFGLPENVRVTPFEAPHTEENFLLKEMGFALARKHARTLRRWTLILLAVIPAVLCMVAMLAPAMRPLVAVGLIVSVMSAVLLERWLFFAQARHVVMTYYDARPT